MNTMILTGNTQIIGSSAQQITSSSTSIVSIIIFFGILGILVFLFFYFLKKTNRYVAEQEKLKQASTETIVPKSNEEPTDEISVAIALALSMYKIELTEQENLTLTIQKVSRMYSPWSSKIYSLRQLPR